MSNALPTRLTQVLDELSARKADCLVVTSLVNVRYLTGFTGSNAVLVVSPERSVLFTDPRYATQAPQETRLPVRVAKRELLPHVAKLLVKQRRRRWGFEKGRATWAEHAQLKESLPLGASLVPVDAVIETLRLVKSDAEIGAIRQAVAVNSQAFERASAAVRAGMSEMDLAAELDHQQRLLGAERPAFETIVASGTRAALPHARPTANPLQPHRLLLIDMGASVAGYNSDMTRMLSLGEPSADEQRLYTAVRDAQAAGIAAVRPGVKAMDVDRAARQTLKAHGLDRRFTHSTGHGLGLEIHEGPRLGRRQKTRLEAGMVVTIEPGVYVEGVGGVRLEDTVLVTANGCEVLTPTPKELRVL